MTSYCFKFSFLLLLFFPWQSIAQAPVLWEVEAEVNSIIKDRWTYTAGVANRNVATSDLENAPLQIEARHIQMEVNTAYEVGFYTKLGGGIMYRFNTLGDSNAENELRFTQQFSIASYVNAARWVHRFKADQRIEESRTEHRLRYRLSNDFPLQGLSLDTREFYMVWATESLFNYGNKLRPMWDQRFTISFGNQITDAMKIQLDLEYRKDDYFKTSGSRIFVVTGIFYKI